MNIAFETLRSRTYPYTDQPQWERAEYDAEPAVSVDSTGQVTITLRGSAAPPWRVVVDGEVIFERTA